MFAPINKHSMNIEQAFWDFYEYVKQPHIWATIPHRERINIYNAKHTVKGKAKMKGRLLRLGPERLKSLMDKYAPGRYEVRISIQIKE